MANHKKRQNRFPARKVIAMFVAAMTGFFALSALSAYWALAFVARPATATIRAATVTMPMQTVKVYFSNSDFNKKMIDCGLVYPVERQVQKTPAIARSALNELLAGLTWDEANAGYYNSINSGVVINSLAIKNSTARVDFSKRIEEGAAGSCNVSAIRAQITSTLMQFPNVKTVIISVDGRTEDALQP